MYPLRHLFATSFSFQAVLACDVERTNLLQEEQQILAKMAAKVCAMMYALQRHLILGSMLCFICFQGLRGAIVQCLSGTGGCA